MSRYRDRWVERGRERIWSQITNLKSKIMIIGENQAGGIGPGKLKECYQLNLRKYWSVSIWERTINITTNLP